MRICNRTIKTISHRTLKKFLDFWAREIDGKLHSVNISSKGIISANDLGLRDSEYALH